MATHHGRPAKRAKKNISGLKNQPRPASSPESPACSPSPTDSLGDYSDTQILDTMEMDSIMYLEVDTDHDDSDEADWDKIAENEFNNRLLEMAAQMEEDRLDAEDDDWIPTKEAYEAQRAADRWVPGGELIITKSRGSWKLTLLTGRPKEYMKGPDTASKRLRTQRRYAAMDRKQGKKQGKLDGFMVQESAPQPDTLPESSLAVEADLSLSLGLELQSSLTPASTAPPSRAPSPGQTIPQTRSASVLSVSSGHSSPPLIVVDNSDEEMEEDDPNNWDVIIDDMVGGEDQSSSSPTASSSSPTASGSSHMAQPDQSGEKTVKLQSWHALREKVKTDLKKKNLPLTQYNQLLIIQNFATLLIKGLKRIQASLEIARQWHEGGGNYFSRCVRALVQHYQIFEELPLETRGGRANTKSLLNDESGTKSRFCNSSEIP
ncbi:hypothetical protein B0H13DRAFT_2497390 [Mycena leptocephala]|nr:hypothetical protein B0H13DRAFT_2497390 [Mycena leptocephala]